MSRAIGLNGVAGLCDEGDFRLVVGASEGDGDDFGVIRLVVGRKSSVLMRVSW